MRHKKILAHLVLVAVIMLVCLAISPRPALAASLSVSPTSGKFDTVVYVYGTGFTPGVTYRTYFAYGTTYESVRSGTVAVDGTVSPSIRVPEVPGGSYTIRVETAYESASGTFSVLPAVSLDKTSAAVGDQVTVSGTGFRASRRVNISFDGSVIETTSTNSIGSFTSTFKVPACYNRTADVEASDGAFVASKQLTILASISLSPTSGKVGEEITVTGNGFRSNRSITLTVDGAEVDTEPESIRSNSMGCFEASLDIPVSSQGSHSVRAYDGANAAKASFTTLADISLNPTSGRIGTEITVSGTGFGSSTVVTVRFSNKHVRTTATDITGNFTTQFLVPQYQTGNYEVSASDNVATASTNFTLTVSVNVSPTSGHVGTPINVTGSGFIGAITVRYDNTVVVTTTADGNGDFSATFNAPASTHGHHKITVSGAISTV